MRAGAVNPKTSF